jgi:hypothetical protein
MQVLNGGKGVVMEAIDVYIFFVEKVVFSK